MHYSRAEINSVQCTLERPVCSSGIAPHSGDKAFLTLSPAPPNSGTHFLRRDVDITRAVIPASWQSVTETHPDTLLNNEFGIGVHGVEALLAALRGCGVDNVLVEVSGYELPAFAGSSLSLLRLINEAGVVTQGATRQIIWVDRFIGVRIGEHYACIKPGRIPSITIDDMAAGSSNIPLGLSFELLDHVFERQIAPARHPQQVISSGDRSAGSTRPTNSGEAPLENEFLRYRMLESLGLLALAQMPIYGQIYFHKPCAFLIEALLHELFALRDNWRQLSFAEIEQITGTLAPGSYQKIADLRSIPADTLLQ